MELCANLVPLQRRLAPMAYHLHGSILRPLSIAVYVVPAFFVTLPTIAQRTPVRTRITAAIDNSSRTTLVGSRSPRAITANDVGAVAPDMPLQGVTLVFSETPTQQTALDALAAAQQNPASPLYHQWLNPGQYAARFGVADADIATAESWLEREGFVIGSVSRSHNRITFSGTAGQVAAAFGTSIHNYKAPGEPSSHFASSADLSVPSALAPIVQRVGNLSNYRPHSSVVIRPTTPSYTTGTNQAVFLSPKDVATVYDVKSIYDSGYNGAGQTIAIVGQSAVNPTDLSNFQTALGVSVNPQTLYLIPGTGASTILSGDETESDLDLEYASAMAPGAAVIFYYVGDSGNYSVYDSITQAVDDNVASILSISYGACEPDFGSGWLDAALEQAAVQGQTVVAAAGDWGSLSCAVDGFTPAAHQDTPAVFYPASSPWVVALGGTEFPAADVATNPINTTYWQAAMSGTDVLSTALSYIPEVVWNDGFIAGGGGSSVFEAQPLWQEGVPGIANGIGRLVPDISLAASPINPGYLICSSDAEWGAAGNCTTGFISSNGYSYSVVGGTSAAAPIFAGLVAVLNQAKGYTTGQGLLDPTLYALASNAATYASAFHDITVGGNNCTNTLACGSGPQNYVYMAGVGYDEASGLGSIDFANLVWAWPESTDPSTATTTTTLTASSTTPDFESSVILTATVSNGSIGNVTFLDGVTALGMSPVNGSGVATLTVSTLPAGGNSITANYAGTTGYSPSTSGAVTINVLPMSTITTLAAASTNNVFWTWFQFTATVISNGGPATGGNIGLYCNGSFIGTLVVSGTQGIATTNIETLPVGTDLITASYEGTPSFAPSVSSSLTVTVAPAATNTTLTVSPTSSVYGNAYTLKATVLVGPTAAYPGVVTFLSNGAPIATASMVSNGIAMLYISTLPGGTDSITASFAATSNFAASVSSPVLVTVTPAPTTTALNTSTSSSPFGNSVTFTATVAGGGNTATSGTVTFVNGGAPIGAATVNSSGVATFSLSSLAVGTDSIAASYGGTSNFAASISSAVMVTVAPCATTTVLSSSSTNPTFGSGVTLTATVSMGGTPATSGVITFLDGASSIGTGVVISGVSTLNLTTLPTGANSITASFGGTSNLAASSSKTVMVTVSPATTTTSLSASPLSAIYGSSVVLRATVSDGGSPASTGLVTFLDGGTLLGTETVVNGIATLNMARLALGSNLITATFGATPILAASVSNTVLVTVTIPQVSTVTTLSSSSTSASPGDSVMFTATVTSDGAAVASGTVTFLNGGSTIGTGTVYNGVALMSLSTLPTGTDSITASYGGTSNLATSASSAVIVTVAIPAEPVPPTSITVIAPPPVVAGGVVTSTASLSAGGSYSGTMKMTCRLTGSPAGAQSVPTCSLNPAILTLAVNGVGTAVLTVQTTAATSKQAKTSGLNLWGLGGGSALAGLLMFCIPSRRRRLLSMVAALIVVASGGFVGCGGGAAAVVVPPLSTTPATTSGAYSFTVSGADALNPAITTSAVVSVTVE
jgi:subtilase family serine protease